MVISSKNGTHAKLEHGFARSIIVIIVIACILTLIVFHVSRAGEFGWEATRVTSTTTPHLLPTPSPLPTLPLITTLCDDEVGVPRTTLTTTTRSTAPTDTVGGVE